MSSLGRALLRFGLSSGATQAELRTAYFKKAKLLHPDIAGPDSESEFKQLKEDYESAKTLLKQGERGGGPAGDPGQGPGPGPSAGPGYSDGDYSEQSSGAWFGPKGQRWKPGGDPWWSKYQAESEELNFDPEKMKREAQSHTRTDGTYRHSGSRNPNAPREGPRPKTPAEMLRFVLNVSAGVFVGITILQYFHRQGQYVAERQQQVSFLKPKYDKSADKATTLDAVPAVALASTPSAKLSSASALPESSAPLPALGAAPDAVRRGGLDSKGVDAQVTLVVSIPAAALAPVSLAVSEVALDASANVAPAKVSTEAGTEASALIFAHQSSASVVAATATGHSEALPVFPEEHRASQHT